MKSIFFSLLVAVSFLTQPVEGAISLTKKNGPSKSLKTSLIVPCAPRHFQYIDELLLAYAHQTQLVDEVIISLSECEKVSSYDIQTVEHHHFPFVVKIIKNKEKCSPGKNRNIAFSHSTGDLILCFDADDLPYPQRVELVKYIFENYEVDQLFHLWAGENVQQETYSYKNLSSWYQQKAENYPYAHNACVSMLRHVCTNVKWPENLKGRDEVKFNTAVSKYTKKVAVLGVPLITYRTRLSSFAP